MTAHKLLQCTFWLPAEKCSAAIPIAAVVRRRGLAATRRVSAYISQNQQFVIKAALGREPACVGAFDHG